MGKGKNKRVHQELSHSANKQAIGFMGCIECGPNESHGPSRKTRKLECGIKFQAKNNNCVEKYVQPKSYERTLKYEDKKSEHYERYIVKEKVSSGETHVEKGSGRVGVKDECSWSSKVKVGNRSGYTEYYTEERVRKVDFGKSECSQNNIVLTGGCYLYSSDGH
ncbi:hypothetical protein LguiA_018857 [Lonicera macranthoides]